MRGRMVLRTIRMTIGTLRMATSRWHWLIDGSQITSARGIDDPSGVESPPVFTRHESVTTSRRAAMGIVVRECRPQVIESRISSRVEFFSRVTSSPPDRRPRPIVR